MFAIHQLSAAGYSERLLLDTLIQRGAISETDGANIAKSTAEIPVVVSDKSSSVKISAKMQTQYLHIDTSNDDGISSASTDVNKFLIRRMILTFDADNKDDWGAKLSFDFVLENKVSITYIWHSIDNDFIKGEFRFGYLKPNFCYEENMSPFKLYCVERSIATYYWGGPRNSRRLGFGSFMTGAYWYGNSRSIKGLEYSLAVTNSENYQLGSDTISGGKNNAPNLWLSCAYLLNLNRSAKTKFGLNLGYGADANKESSGDASAIIGVNPYATFDWGNLRSAAEFLLSSVDGGNKSVSGSREALPMGLNFLIEYKFEIGDFGQIAPVFRYTWLDTDGHGINPSDGLRKCLNISKDLPYRRAQGFYFGLNWYLIQDTLKVQAGYEFSQFEGSIGTFTSSSHSLNANSARAQIQILF